MARFDTYKVRPTRYLIDVQAYAITGQRRRMLVPLVPPEQVLHRVPDLHPTLALGTLDLVFLADLMASLPTHRLPAPIANLAHFRDPIVRALDVLLTGF